MNLLRSQIAALITKSAQAGLKKLDKNSALACKLKGMDIDTLLKDSVNKLCDEMYSVEMVKFMSLVAQLKSGFGDQERIKEDTKKIAKDIVKRIEQKTGNLNIPSDIRDLILNL